MIFGAKQTVRACGGILLLTLELLATFLTGLLVLGALLAWRLSDGPLTLAALEPYLAKTLNNVVAPYQIRIGETALIWGDEVAGPLLEAKDVRLITISGTEATRIPRLQIRFSLPALLLGRPAPSVIRVIGAELQAIRLTDGRVNLTIAPAVEGAAADNESSLINAWFAKLARPPVATSMLGALRRLEIADARLRITDLTYGISWNVPRMDLRLVRAASGMSGDVSLAVLMGAQRSLVNGTLDYARESGRLNFQLSLDRFNPSEMAVWAPAFHEFAPYNVPLSGVVSGVWRPDFGVERLGFDLSAGTGVVPGFVPNSSLQLTYIKLEAELDRQQRLVRLSNLALEFDGARLVAAAEGRRLDNQVALNAVIQGSGLKIVHLANYWPLRLAPGARRWVVSNIESGLASDLQVRAEATYPLQEGGRAEVQSVVGRILVDDAVVHYLRPMPPARKVKAEVLLGLDEVSAAVSAGEVDGVRLLPTTVKLLGLREGTDRAEIDLRVEGSMAAQLALIDHPRLGFAKRMDIVPASAKGRAVTQARFAFPLLKDLPIEKVAISAAAEMEGVGLPDVVSDQDLTDGQLKLTLDGAGMNIAGKGLVGGAPAVLDWREEFLREVQPNTLIRFKATLDDAVRRNFRIEWPEVVTGSFEVDGTYKKNRGEPAEIDASLDFQQAALALPWFGWHKPQGGPAKGAFTAILTGGSVSSVPSLSVKGSGLALSGKVSFAERSRWDTVTLASLSVPGTALSGTVSNRGVMGPLIKFKGTEVDVRALFDDKPGATNEAVAAAEPSKPPALTPFDVTFDFKEATTGEGRIITAAKGRLARDAYDWQHVEVDGRVGKVPLMVRLTPSGSGRYMLIKSDDAGAMLGALRLMDNIEGGTIHVEGASKSGGAIRGVADIRNFRYLQAPTLKRLATAAQPEGAETVTKVSSLKFDRLKANFVYDRYLVEVRGGRLAGPSLGMTLDGFVDLHKSAIDLNGTFVPLYGVNSLVSGIPVVGWLLTGGEGGGVFAATYSIRGKLRAPDVSVNPLSMLTPGFLRNMLFLNEAKRPR